METPSAMPSVSTLPMEPMPQPAPREDAKDYNGGPTPEANQEAAIKRFLTHLSSIKNRPALVPVLYQY